MNPLPGWPTLHAEPLSATARAVAAARGSVSDAATRLAASRPGGWSGQGADAFAADQGDELDQLHGLVAGLDVVVTTLQELATAVMQAHTAYDAARMAAANADLTVDAVPVVRPRQGVPDDPQRAVVARAITEELDLTGVVLATADRQAAGVLDDVVVGLTRRAGPRGLLTPSARLLMDERGLSSALRPQPVPVGADAPVVALWWTALTSEQQAVFEQQQPQLLGGLDGIPVDVRDRINRRLLAAERGRLRAKEVQPAPPPSHSTWEKVSRALGWLVGGAGVVSAGFPSLLNPDTSVRLPIPGLPHGDDPRERLAALDELEREVDKPGRSLLLFDPRGQMRAEIGDGDLVHARSVGVVVPGMNNPVDRQQTSARLTGEAAALRHSAPGSATVAFEYLTPNVVDVASPAKAQAAAPDLVRLVHGLRADDRPVQRVTVIGHSYGTLTTSLAAREGLGANDVVFVGSPGVGVEHAGDLGMPAAHVWSATTGDDPIRLVFDARDLGDALSHLSFPLLPHLPYHYGPNPSDPAFGARPFSVAGSSGHSEYFEADSASLRNLGHIVSGDYALVTLPR